MTRARCPKAKVSASAVAIVIVVLVAEVEFLSAEVLRSDKEGTAPL